MQLHIEALGHTVRTAPTPVAALASLRKCPAQVVVAAGIEPAPLAEFCTAARGLPGRAPLILAVPRDDSAAAARSLLEAGADDILPAAIDDPAFEVRLAVAERRAARTLPAGHPTANPVTPAGEGILRTGPAPLNLEALLAAIIQSSDAAIISYDGDGRITSWNAGAEQLYGLTAAEMIGGTADRFVPPGQEASLRELRRAARAAEPARIDTVRLGRGGRLIDVRIAIFPLFGPSGENIGTAASTRDITAEKRLAAEASRLAAIVESTTAAIILRDHDGHVVSWNAAAEQLYGYSAAEMLGRDPAAIAPPDRAAKIAGLHQRVLAGELISVETQRVNRAGQRIDVGLSVFPVRDATGQIIGTAGQALDITPRKQAERALAESEGRFRSVAETMAAALFVYRGTTIVYANSAAVELTGYSVEELTRPDFWLQLAHPDDRDISAAHGLARLAGKPAPPRYELRIVRKDGETRWIDFSAGALTYDGLPASVGIAIDVTERKQAEEALRSSEANYRGVFEGTAEALYVMEQGDDGQFRCIAVNDAYVTLMDRPRDRVVGRTLAETSSDAATAAALQARFQTALDTGSPQHWEWTDVVGGREVTASVLATPFRAADGRKRIVGSARDITGQKRATEALRTAEQYLRTLVASAPIIMSGVDTAGVYTVTLGAGLAAIGRESGAAVGRSAFDDFGRESAVGRAITRALEGTPSTEEVELGGYLWDTRYTPVRNPEGEITGVIGVSLDVTERHRLERERLEAMAALAASEARLRALFESAADAFILMDGEARIFSFNRAANDQARRLLGRDIRTGERLDALFPPDRGSHMRARLDRALKGELLGSESEFADVNGQLHCFELTHFPIIMDDGSVSGAALVSRDITQRKRAEESLRTQQAFSDATVESLPGIFYIISAEGNFLRTNRRFQEVSGYSQDDVRRMPVLDFFDGEDRTRIAARMAEVFATGESSAEADLISASGDRLPYFFTGRRVLYEGATCLVGMGVDVRDRRAAEAALRESEANLRAIFDSTLDAILLLDRGLRVVQFNPAAAEITRRIFGAELRPGLPIREAYPDDMEVVRSMIPVALQGQPASGHVTTASGAASFEMVLYPVRQDGGEVTGLVLVARDVTERRRAEEALRQAQKLESLGVLAGGIAHDFNNLLVGILGNAGLALAELSPTSPARGTIEDIERAGQRAADLARQMLAYSGKGRFVIQQLQLSDLVEEMTHLLRVSIAKGVTMTYSFAHNLPPVAADATQLRQVIMNLVVNASDAIGEDEGVLTLATGMVDGERAGLSEAYLAPELPAGQYVFLDVTDSGCGMDQETLARIFDPFFTTKFTGRGLGLAAVLGIVRGHRGALKVQSKRGSGTTFRLLLPACTDPVATEPPAAAPPGTWRGSGTVLIVDDEPSVRAVTRRALTSLGFTVLEAADGREGVDTFAANAPDIVCVLLDLTMPRLNGEDAFREIHAIRASVPIVVMSGYSEQEAANRFEGEGFAGFMQKPYDIRTLRETLRAVLSPP